MTELLPFIVIGVATGAIYGIAAVGLVVTFKTSGIFNFGHGAIATLGAYVFYWFYVEHHVNWIVSGLISVIGVGVLLGLIMERLAAALAPQAITFKVVGTVGVILVVEAIANIWHGQTTIQVNQFLPGSNSNFEVGGVNIQYSTLVVTCIGVVITGALYFYLRLTRMGVIMRAVVDDADLVSLHGNTPASVRRLSWIIGSSFAALSGVLLVPLIGLQAALLTGLVVQAFGAATVGVFSNLPLTFAGGLVIGIATSISTKYVITVPWLAGLPSSIPFIVLFIGLLVIPKRKLAVTPTPLARPVLPWRTSPRYLLVGAAVTVVIVLLIPQVVGSRLPLYTVAMTYVLLLLSLGMLVRTSGQVSLCHAAFAACGAAAFGHLTNDWHVPWVLAIVLAGLIAVPIGAFVAIPAIRLSGIYLALATFGFGVLVQSLLFTQNWMFGSSVQGLQINRPSNAQDPKTYFYVVAAVVAIVSLGFVALLRSRLGRMLRGMSTSSSAVTAMGLSTTVLRVLVFCLASAVAAVAGALYGGTVGYVTASDSYFGYLQSLLLIALVVIAPFAEPWFALLASIGIVIPGYISGVQVDQYRNILFGVIAILTAVQGGRFPTIGWVRRLIEAKPRPRLALPGDTVKPAPVQVDRSAKAFEVLDVTVRFGGVTAVNGAALTVGVGQLVGLIGPNGAGKTSLFDACSGFNLRFDGVVRANGHDISGYSAAKRARRGVGRTFQRMQLSEGMTVRENVEYGRECLYAGSNPIGQIFARRKESSIVAEATARALQLCGITDLAEVQVGQLSTGHRRLTELARVLAGPFDVLLLDEPCSGLDSTESAVFARLLRTLVDEHGISILLVDHDMSLVLDVCSYIYVLDFGSMIFEGTPAEVKESVIVREVYLGSSELEGYLEETPTS